MKEQETANLFTRRKVVTLALGVIGGIGINAYRTYKDQGSLDFSWFIFAAITLLIAWAIFFFVARYASSPEKEK